MKSKSGAILFFVTTMAGTFAFLTGCDQENITPTKEDAAAIYAARLHSDSAGVPPADTIGKDTTIIVLSPDTTYFPPDTTKKDTLKHKPRPFSIDSLIPKPPKDSIRTDIVKKK